MTFHFHKWDLYLKITQGEIFIVKTRSGNRRKPYHWNRFSIHPDISIGRRDISTQSFHRIWHDGGWMDRDPLTYIFFLGILRSSRVLFFPRIASVACCVGLIWIGERRDATPEIRQDIKRLKITVLCTTISPEPEVVSGWIEKRFKGESQTLLTIVHPLTGNGYFQSYRYSKFF